MLDTSKAEELQYRVELLFPEHVLVSLNDLIEVQESLAELLEIMHKRYFTPPDPNLENNPDLPFEEKYPLDTELENYRHLLHRYEAGYPRTLRLMREQLHLKK